MAFGGEELPSVIKETLGIRIGGVDALSDLVDRKGALVLVQLSFAHV